MKRRPNIYCILCPSFHGATLLSLVLGNHSRVWGLGDTIPGTPRPVTCGCGKPFDDCQFWTRVRELIGRCEGRMLFPPDFYSDNWVSRYTLYNRAISKFAFWSIRNGISWPRGQAARAYEKFLSVCLEFDDIDEFVDGFKNPRHYLTLKVSGFPVKGILHLVRDPRAFVASAVRSPKWTVDSAARVWRDTHNGIMRMADQTGERLLTVKYEQICENPDREFFRIQTWMNLQAEHIVHPIAQDVHWLGNISLIKFTGEIKLRERWRTELDPYKLATIREIAGPLAHTLGYGL